MWHAVERGQGPVLVLLHGIGMSHHAWDPVMDRLAQRFRVIAFDLPGFGATPPLANHIQPNADAMVESLSNALAHRGIEQPVHIAGNSLGGRIALEAAAKGLAASIVALSPAGLWKDQAPKHIKWVFATLRQSQQRAPGLTRRILQNPVGRTVALAAPMSAKGWRVPVDHALQSSELFACSKEFDKTFEAFRNAFQGGGNIEVPVTVAFGNRDWIFPRYTQYTKRLPEHARLLSLKGCGHVPMWDNPGLVARVIESGAKRL